MRSKPLNLSGKANSLVFTFGESLRNNEENFDSPEPDYLKWVNKALYLDVMISGDEAEDKTRSEQEREAWRLYRNALEATQCLFELYQSDVSMFQKMAAQMMVLPCFMSWHPENQKFNRKLLDVSTLSLKNWETSCLPKPLHLARQSWPTRYAYAIIETIDLTMDTYESKLPIWADVYGYGIKHPVPMSRYEDAARRLGWDEAKMRLELPSYVGSYDVLPVWTKTLESLRRPFNSEHVLDYWRTGKEMILEEMPEFHLKPEWVDYQQRKYKGGAKPGTIQHAIFKDILAALETIAGKNRKKSR